jgi:acetyl esterase/lipase
MRARALRSLAVAIPLLLLGGCSSVPPPSGAGPLRYRDPVFDGVTVTRDLAYGSAPGRDGAPETLRLDLYEPVADAAEHRPVLVWVHGGGYSGGDKASGLGPLYGDLFARTGYVVVSINYRLLARQGCSGGTAGTSTCVEAAAGAIHDAQAAVRWLRANAATYRLDTTRIGIGGESAGGITATGVGVRADEPGDSGTPDQPSDVRAFFSISGGLPGGVFVDAGDAPGYLISGTADSVVPYVWSVQTAAALRSAGRFVVLRTLDGAGHVPFVQYRELMERQAQNFFYLMLDAGSADR